MEPYKIKVNILENPKIKSETPGEQKLREDFFIQNHDENSSSSDSYQPVFKMTKQETTFTKGDQKVQKVFIKEDIADGSLRYLIETPLNPNIQSATIAKPHLIRFIEHNHRNHDDCSSEKCLKNNIVLPQPRSRIPRLGDKLKHIVDQMKNDGIATEKSELAKEKSARPSNIPQPHPRAPPRIKRIQRTKHNQDSDTSVNIDQKKSDPDEEFNKLFEEIVDKEPNPVLVAKVLNVRTDSITDVKFEEIIHDYDTNKLKPIFIDEQNFLSKSKIPTLKRKSEGNIKVSSFLQLFEEKSKNDAHNQSVKKPVRKNKKIVDNSKVIVSHDDIVLKNINTDDEKEAENKRKESKIPLLKQVSNETIKYPGKHRRASLKKSISQIDDASKHEVKKNDDSNKLDIERFENGKEIFKQGDALAKPREQVNISDNRDDVEIKLFASNEIIQRTPSTETDKGEAFFEHDIRMKYEKLSRENSQEINGDKENQMPVFENANFPNTQGQHVNDFEKIKENKIVLNVDKEKNPSLNIPQNNTTKELSEVNENKSPLVELRKKFEYLSKDNPHNNIIRSQKISPTIEKTDISIQNDYTYEKNITSQNETIDMHFDETRTKQIENQEQINALLGKFVISGENSPIDINVVRKEQAEFPVAKIESKSVEETNIVQLQETLVPHIEVVNDGDDVGEVKIKNKDIDDPKKDKTPKKSVLAKVELFERQSSTDSSPKSASHYCAKPKIVEEVLKTPILPRNGDKDIVTATYNNYEMISELPIYNIATAVVIDSKVNLVTEPASNLYNDRFVEAPNNDVQNINYFSRQPSKTIKPSENAIESEKELFNNFDIQTLKVKEERNDNEIKDTFIGHNLVNDRKLRFEKPDVKIKATTTSADAIIKTEGRKEKVSDLVKKGESLENLKFDESKNIIPPKERPRRNSVSEKIALFERKLTVFNMDELTSKITSKESKSNINSETYEKLAQKPEAMPDQSEKENDATVANTDEDGLNLKIMALKNAHHKYGIMDRMSYVKLQSGTKMPVIAIGTALLEPSLCRHIIEAAINLGYRAFDTAYIYGNEKDVGDAIRNKIQDGTVKREDLFISSKLWSTFHRPDLVPQACQNTLDNLGLEYLDLFMIHNPMSFKEGPDPLPMIANVLQYSEYDYMDAWYAMEGLLDTGIVKNIGVSNFNSEQLQKILDKGTVRPVVNQVESHPYLTQERLKRFCDAHQIQLQCYGTLGSAGTPGEYKSPGSKVAMNDALVKVMAAGLNVTPAQLLISYQLQSGRAVVVKSSSADRLWSNLQALELQLTDDQINALNALNINNRNFGFVGMGDTHRNYPFNIPY